MKGCLLIIVIPFLFITPAHGQDEWDRADKTMFASFLNLQVADCLQTQYIFQHSDQYYEKNYRMNWAVDKFGSGVIPFYFATYIGGTFLATNNMPSWARKITLGFLSYLAFRNVENNMSIGIGFAF